MNQPYRAHIVVEIDFNEPSDPEGYADSLTSVLEALLLQQFPHLSSFAYLDDVTQPEPKKPA
jgi:hypothetical protein